MFSMLTLCIKHIHNILTKINKYYIYDDDQTLKFFFSSLIFGVIFWLFVIYGIDNEVLHSGIIPKPKLWYRAIPTVIRGGRYDQNLISRYDKFYITITIYITI